MTSNDGTGAPRPRSSRSVHRRQGRGSEIIGFGQGQERAERLVALCAVLERGRPVTLAECRDRFGLYRQDTEDAARQQFERDKRQLRDLGVEVVTIPIDGTVGYRIDPRVRGVPVQWTDEQAWTLAVLAATIGDEASGAALATIATAVPDYPPPDPGAAIRVDLDAPAPVLAALRERRRLHFDYRAATGAVTRRVVEPWGLASRRSLHYLTGYDVDRAAPRVFRLDRIGSTPEVGAPSEHPVPVGLGLSLVPDERRTVTVSIAPARLPDAAAIGGQLVDASPDAVTVRFDHLRDETVLGWSLRHGAAIIDPADLAEEIAARRHRILDRHRRDPAPVPAGLGAGTTRTRRHALSETRLRRLLTLPAWLESKPGIQLEEIAQAFGCSTGELTAELALLDLADVPGIGSIVEVTTDRDQLVVRLHAKPPTVQLRLADAFRILALVAAARVLLPPDEVPALDEIEQTVRKAVDLDPHVGLTDLALADPRLPVLRGAVEAGQVVRFPYRGRHDDTWAERRLLAATLRAANGAIYLLGHDLDANAGRSFRLDRMGPVTVADPADLPTDAAGRPIPVETPRYVPDGDEVEVTLRLSPRATWMLAVLDPVGTSVENGGEVVTRVRTDSPDWVLGHVLAAGGEAELVTPSDLRALVVARAQF